MRTTLEHRGALHRERARPIGDDFSYDYGTATATWRFEDWTLGDQYTIVLNADAITDADGDKLDGEWTNPAHTTVTTQTSTFPSGNGTTGGDFAW